MIEELCFAYTEYGVCCSQTRHIARASQTADNSPHSILTAQSILLRQMVVHALVSEGVCLHPPNPLYEMMLDVL